MSATAFQRRRRELAKEQESNEEIVMVPVAGDMTVMGRERTPADEGTTFANQHPREVRASATAEKLAAERGINLRTIEGTGADGAITVSDVRKAASPTVVE